MRSADRNRVRRSFCECCRKGPAHTPCADNDNLFHASPSWPLRQDLRHIRLVDTFNNEFVIDCPLLAVLRDTLIGFAVIPILSGFHVREFRNDDSLDRIAFKDFMLSIGDEHFDRMTFHRCSDSRPICFELFLINGLRSREYNVCRHDRSPVLLSNYSRIALVSRNASIPYRPYSRPMPEYLNPPQGACASSVMRLITTRPARICEATRRARWRSVPRTAAWRPYLESFAIRIASSSES